MQISSTSNARVRALAKLKQRRGREESGRFLIEGARELERAAEAGIELAEVLFCRELADDARTGLAAELHASGVPMLELAPAPFHRVAYREKPDGLIGVGITPDTSLDRLQPRPGGITLVAEAIEKPGNLGAMVRTADAAGCDAVIAADPETDLFNPNVVRAAQGSLFALPVATAAPAAVIRWAKRHDVLLVAADPAATMAVWEVDLTPTVAIVVGSEHSGLTPAWANAAIPVSIPMAGTADSLNASVAAAVLLFEAVRQRSVP